MIHANEEERIAYAQKELGLDFGARYQQVGWPGVAVRIDGPVQRFEPYMVIMEDEDGDEYETPDPYGEGEMIDDLEGGQVVVVMVGDDARHTVDVEDLTMLDELDYCSVCGQVGCSHDGRDRS